jgi:leucine-rich PPR motif-containing protein
MEKFDRCMEELDQKAIMTTAIAILKLKAALRAGDLKLSMACFESLVAMKCRHETPSNTMDMLTSQLVKLSAQTGDLAEMLSLFEKLGCSAQALEVILAESASAGAGDIVQRAEQLGRSQGVKFTAGAFQALMKCGSVEDARKLLSEAQQNGVADVATYNTCMKMLLATGNCEEGRKMIDAMRHVGLQPNQVSFNELLSAAVATNAESAWDVIDDMKACRIKPNHATCSILLKCVPQQGNLQKMLTFMSSAAQDGCLDEAMFASVLEACVRSGRADLLVSFLKKQHVSKNIVIKTPHTYASMVRAYGFLRDLEGAWATWSEMQKNNILPSSVALGCMVEALTQNGEVEAGYQLLHEMIKDTKTAHLVNAVIYGSVLKGFSHQKDFKRVWAVSKEMKSLNLQFSSATFNTLIDACARCGDLDRVPMLLEEMDAQGMAIGIITYSAVVKGYCQADRLDEAFSIFDNMTKTTNLKPDEQLFNVLLDGCARKGLYHRGMELLKKMQDSGVRPSNFTLSVLVKLANRGKQLEKAFELSEEFSSKYNFRLNVHVFNNLIQACIQHRDLPRAFNVLERMVQESVRPDERTYSMLLTAFVEAKQPQEAAGLLRGAVGLRGSHPRLANHPAAKLQPQGGLSGKLILDILSDIDGPCHERHLAAALLNDLNRAPGIKLDPKLKLKLAARFANIGS